MLKTGVKSIALCVALGAVLAMGQSATETLILNPVYTGLSIVSGTAVAGSSPITIYDTSYATRSKIGTAAGTASDGKFYCAVKPALIAGHKIIAVDKMGNVSSVVTVTQKAGALSPAPQ